MRLFNKRIIAVVQSGDRIGAFTQACVLRIIGVRQIRVAVFVRAPIDRMIPVAHIGQLKTVALQVAG